MTEAEEKKKLERFLHLVANGADVHASPLMISKIKAGLVKLPLADGPLGNQLQRNVMLGDDELVAMSREFTESLIIPRWKTFGGGR